MTVPRLQTLILCGGEGTRIRGVADDVPKPMIRIGERPIVWHIMKTYAHFGFNDFVLLLGYRGEVIKQYFLDYRAMTSNVVLSLGKSQVEYLAPHEEMDWRVALVDTGRSAMTGVRIFRGARFCAHKRFLATYGDGVADVNIAALLEFHESHGKMATVTGVRPPGRFGELRTEGHLVRGFAEKPQVAGGLINGGFFVFNLEFVERYLENDDGLVLERAPLEQAARDGNLAVFQHSGFWQPMDTYREWVMLNELWNSGKAPWKVWS